MRLEYQTCPKCEGWGEVLDSPGGWIDVVKTTCPVCEGKKVIKRPNTIHNPMGNIKPNLLGRESVTAQGIELENNVVIYPHPKVNWYFKKEIH